MNKLTPFILSILMVIAWNGHAQNKSKTPNSNGNEGQGRENLILPHGNMGLNTLHPTERLEVIGNVKVSNTLFVKDIDVVGLKAVNLSVSEDAKIGRHLLVNGNVGIGVANPTERLEISGNLKVSDGIFSNTLDVNTLTANNGTFNQNLLVKQNFNVEGLTGLGVSNPSERLEVNGNMKVRNGIYTQTIEGAGFTFGEGTVSNNLNVGGNGHFTGNVGIGVAIPAEKLHVDGNIKASGNISGAVLTVTDGNFSGNTSIQKNITVTGNSNLNGKVTTNTMTVKGAFEVRNNANIVGTLGIGIGIPEATLHVAGDGKFDGNVTATKLIVQELEVANMDFGNGSAGGNMSFNENLFVKGSVGIGSERISGYKLSVNGKIRASDDIKVYPSSQWADYVFDEEYELRPLEEVEAFINTNKHLPGMPTTAEVEKNGIDLGAMDAKLLEKVEELTLYMINLKKENDQLKREIQALRQSTEN